MRGRNFSEKNFCPQQNFMVNILAVIVCAILSMVLGSIWFGPLFGKKYMMLAGQTSMSPEEQVAMKKKMMPMYGVSTLLMIITFYVLSLFVGIGNWLTMTLWLFVGFRLTQLAGENIWSNKKASDQVSMFLIQGGYQLITFLVSGYILAVWR